MTRSNGLGWIIGVAFFSEIATDVSLAALFLSRYLHCGHPCQDGPPERPVLINEHTRCPSNSVEMTLFRHVLNTYKIQDGTLKLPKMAKLF
jgi:hypothetical protein